MSDANDAYERAVEFVRKICIALPEATERLSHGAPSFFVKEKKCGKKCFVMFVNDHHGDGNLGVWCAAAPGTQQSLVAEGADWFFVPPYVGHRGWIGLRLDGNLDWEEAREFLLEAYIHVAPTKLIEPMGS